MNQAELKKISDNTNLWRDIKVLYNTYIYPTKKDLGMQPFPCYSYLFKGRNAE